ncbi:MAG: hypothetical protein GXP49_05165 [Deltaproteobacteria bacterium]|nr:hypothetical protein [Deltaproteobacteria bacterium]
MQQYGAAQLALSDACMQQPYIGTKKSRLPTCWCETDDFCLLVKCKDIHEDGVTLITLAEMSPGEQVSLELSSEAGVLKARAEVTWRTPARAERPEATVNLKFKDVLPESKPALARLVSFEA